MISSQSFSSIDSKIVKQAALCAFKKLHPKILLKNPVMFIVGVGSVITTLYFFHDLYSKSPDTWFSGNISLWLWFTVLFANFAEAIAEGRGKAQAESLKKTRQETLASRRKADGSFESIASSLLIKGDVVIVKAGQLIPGDGTVVSGVALVDESAITGESAPVVRESGGDRSAVTGGTTVLSDEILIKITQEAGKSFLDKMIALVEGAVRQKTPNEIALSILLSGMTIVFLLAVVTLRPFALYSQMPISTVVLVALLVCLIPTTIGGLLSSIGIAGMDRLVKRNILAVSGRAVEAAGNIDVILMDKTGTITIGNRMASEFIPAPQVSLQELTRLACLSSLYDTTPEGRSIVALGEKLGCKVVASDLSRSIPFTAETRMSGIDDAHVRIRKGSLTAIEAWLKGLRLSLSEELRIEVDKIGSSGGTPLIVATEEGAMGVIHLKDVVKPGIADRFARIRSMGIKTIMVTGDNHLTAQAIAKEAGVDDFVSEAKPEDKLHLIRTFQQQGKMVAMSGDGTNDAPALAQSDVGLVMNTGTQAARESGNMIDLDSDPTKIIDAVEIGKQLLITRGALTTFSIANDVAKYFAILPALFVAHYPAFAMLNVMRLSSPHSAVLSAVIFNAIIIIFLIPLALRGARYRPKSASSLLRYNVIIYGLGGIIIPFIGIKLIDMILTFFGLI
ncbi:MAG: potassium-transporting ATPase subunit KdpB [Bacteriovoracaceae bacterium]|nr:potassium-transporting ATPase subunit KdpB [Bacteriovoracaceae bacterium]